MTTIFFTTCGAFPDALLSLVHSCLAESKTTSDLMIADKDILIPNEQSSLRGGGVKYLDTLVILSKKI